MKKYLLVLWLFSLISFAFDASLMSINQAFIDNKILDNLDRSYQNSKEELLKSLVKKIHLEVYKKTTVNDPIAIVALSVSYQIFLLEVTLKVARDLIGGIYPCHSTKDYTDMLNTGFYKTYMRPNVGCMGLIVYPYEFIHKIYYNDIYQTLKDLIKQQITDINLTHVKAIELLALRIAQDFMIETHFMKIYDSAYNYIQKHHYEHVNNKENIKEYIASHTWNRSFLEKNTYILFLKHLLNYSFVVLENNKKSRKTCCCNIF